MTWKQEDELSRVVCSAFEPNPPTITARQAREQTRGFVWVSCDHYHSPGGWWVAEIGTDHGPAEDDDKPVRWKPVPDLLTQMDQTWRIVEEVKRRGWLFHILAMVDGWVVNGRRYELKSGNWSGEAMSTTDFVQEPGDEVGEAIALAAIAAMKQTPAHSGDTPS